MEPTFDLSDVPRIANLLRDGLTPRYDASWILGPVHVIWNDAGIFRSGDDTGTEAGTHAAAEYAPPAISFVVTKQTAQAGRRFRGRLYMPGVEESQVLDSGIILGAEVNAWQASMDALFTSVTSDADVTSFALFHDSSTPNAQVATTITSFRVRNVVGSMRPRQRR